MTAATVQQLFQRVAPAAAVAVVQDKLVRTQPILITVATAATALLRQFLDRALLVAAVVVEVSETTPRALSVLVVPVVVVLVRKPLGLVSLEFRTLVVAVAVVVKITPQTVAALAAAA